jgi:hypothetical protein
LEARRAFDAITLPVQGGWRMPIPAPVSRALLRVPVVARLALDRWFLRVAA